MMIVRLLFSPLRLLLFFWFRLQASLGRPGKTLFHTIPDQFTMLRPRGIWSRFIPQIDVHFIEYLLLLKQIAESPEVDRVVYTAPSMRADWSQLEQVANALLQIARSGKELVCYSPGGNFKTIYLMSVADRRCAAPQALFSILLPSVDTYFVKKGLKRLGISVEMQNAGRYKGGGYEMFTRNSFTPEARSSLTGLMKSLRRELQGRIEGAPNMDKASIRRTLQLLKGQAIVESYELQKSGFIEQAVASPHLKRYVMMGKLPLPANEERRHSPLVPTLEADGQNGQNGQRGADAAPQVEKKGKRRHELLEDLRERRRLRQIIKERRLARQYRRRHFVPFRLRALPSLAVVNLEGAITMGRPSGQLHPQSIAALPFQKLLQDLAKGAEEAVFLYINSPGGSADGSEILFEEIYALSRIKPVFAFLGSVAASGGFYIACAADYIYAPSLSITGSIGVIHLRPDLMNLYKKLGIRKESLLQDPTRDLFSESGPLSAAARQLLQRTIRRSYELFLKRVSFGRSKELSEVLKLAEGQVFTARHFQEKGLIDGTLSLVEAMESYRRLQGMPMHQQYRINFYPQVKANIQSLAGNLMGRGNDSHLLATSLFSSDSLQQWQQLLSLLQHSGQGELAAPMAYFPYSLALRNI